MQSHETSVRDEVDELEGVPGEWRVCTVIDAGRGR